MKTDRPTYTLAERDRRWALARDLMAAEDVEALIVYGEHEMVQPAPYAHDVYFTNDRPDNIVVFARDADPIVLAWSPMTIGDHIEARWRGDGVWIAPRQMRVARHPQGVLDVLREFGLEKSAIGVIGLDPSPPWQLIPIMPHVLMSALRSELPEATFKGVYRAFLIRVGTQSDEELAVLAYAAEAGEAMARAMYEVAKPGVTDVEISAAALTAVARRGATMSQPVLQSGPGTLSFGQPPWVYRPQGPRVIAEGDVIVAEAMPQFGMKESQHQVTIAVGDVHPDTERAGAVARAAYEAGLATLRVGNTFGDVVNAMRNELKQGEGWNIHPLIHSINPYGPVCGFGAGLNAQPRAQEYGLLGQVPDIGMELPLAPGMSFSLESNCVIGDHTVNLGGTVVTTDGAPTELAPFSAWLLRA